MAKKSSNKPGQEHSWPRVGNRRAFHDYTIVEKVECGLELLGTEVKSLRAGNANLEGAFARIRGGQVYLCGCNIAVYPMAAGALQHDPLRERRLLLHGRQIAKLMAHVAQKGHTLVPLALYFKSGWAKCELGAAIGKRQYDKRETIRAKQQAREVSREVSRRKYGRE